MYTSLKRVRKLTKVEKKIMILEINETDQNKNSE